MVEDLPVGQRMEEIGDAELQLILGDQKKLVALSMSIIDSDQFARARMVGYLRTDEMVRQGKTFKLSDKKGLLRLYMFLCNNSYRLRVKEFQMATPGKIQSVVDIPPSRVVIEKKLETISFKYTPVLSNSLVKISVSDSMVINTGLSWGGKVTTHQQQVIYGGPFLSKNYRLHHITAHWEASDTGRLASKLLKQMSVLDDIDKMTFSFASLWT